MGFVLSILEADKRRKQKQMAKFAKSKRGQRALNSKRMKKYQEKRLKALQPEVDRRLREEQDHTRGEQVWFSRYILNGRLRHWVLMTHGNKYELRRSENIVQKQRQGQEQREEEEGPKGTEDHTFTFHITPSTIDEEKRKAALAETSIPEIDGFYVCLIGWTGKPKAEVDQICSSIFQQQFGTYHLLWKNCQHFLRMLAEQIITDDHGAGAKNKAADYAWFESNTKTRYQKTQSLMPPPLEFLIRMQQANATMMQNQVQMQNQNQMQMQMQMQNQIQMQMQMQNQIQMQIQNQMQMQNQMAMGVPGMGG